MVGQDTEGAGEGRDIDLLDGGVLKKQQKRNFIIQLLNFSMKTHLRRHLKKSLITFDNKSI